MTENNRKMPLMAGFLVLILVFTGAGGVYGGFSLIGAPDGSLLGMTTDILSRGPFRTFLIPGMILLLFNGLLPLFISWGLIFRPSWLWPESLNLYCDKHWSWTFSLCYGFILIIWINVQIIMLEKTSLLQPLFALTGALISVVTLLPVVFRYYTKQQARQGS